MEKKEVVELHNEINKNHVHRGGFDTAQTVSSAPATEGALKP